MKKLFSIFRFYFLKNNCQISPPTMIVIKATSLCWSLYFITNVFILASGQLHIQLWHNWVKIPGCGLIFTYNLWDRQHCLRYIIIIIIILSPSRLSNHVLYASQVTLIFRRIFLSFSRNVETFSAMSTRKQLN